jgi:hypothetical protein
MIDILLEGIGGDIPGGKCVEFRGEPTKDYGHQW